MFFSYFIIYTCVISLSSPDIYEKRIINGAYSRVSKFSCLLTSLICIIEPVHEISNIVVCAPSKASDQPAHTRSLIRAFASRLSIL